jgi:hypothetical protein
MHANIPITQVLVKNKFLYDLDNVEGFTEAYLFGVKSEHQRALCFHGMLKTGAHWRGLPLHALWWKEPETDHEYSLEHLQLWDCFTEKIQVIQWDYLASHECECFLRTKDGVSGTYLFTIEWLKDSNPDTSFTGIPEQNKCAHVIALSNGQIAALPTNRILFKDAFFVGNKPTAAECGYKVGTTVWTAETCERWSVSEDNSVYYKDEQEKSSN